MADDNKKVIQDAERRAAQYRKEAQAGGTNAPAPADVLQEMADRKAREKSVPTTKTEMGKPFKSGGSVSSASGRADGIAQRGKTRGKTIAMCGGGRMK
jgi:hypothetical protein